MTTSTIRPSLVRRAAAATASLAVGAAALVAFAPAAAAGTCTQLPLGIELCGKVTNNARSTCSLLASDHYQGKGAVQVLAPGRTATFKDSDAYMLPANCMILGRSSTASGVWHKITDNYQVNFTVVPR